MIFLPLFQGITMIKGRLATSFVLAAMLLPALISSLDDIDDDGKFTLHIGPIFSKKNQYFKNFMKHLAIQITVAKSALELL